MILVVAGLLLLTITCTPPYALWIQAGSTRDHLVFAHATKRDGRKAHKVELLLVTTCGGYTQDLRRIPRDTLWYARSGEFIADADASGNTITYGQSIPGTSDSVGPKGLDVGCYSAWIYAPPGSATIDFRVVPNGIVREFSKAERDSAWEVGSRYMRAELLADEQATATCRAKYSNAERDGVAVAAIDLMVPYDTLRFARLTCADLRRVDPRRTDPTYSSSQKGAA